MQNTRKIEERKWKIQSENLHYNFTYAIWLMGLKWKRLFVSTYRVPFSPDSIFSIGVAANIYNIHAIYSVSFDIPKLYLVNIPADTN